jgi:transposase
VTIKQFWIDPYLSRHLTCVASVADSDVTLRSTIFFAFSGGQESDQGTIAGYPVLRAQAEGTAIVHTLPEGHGLAAGQTVEVEIDWTRRYRLMRLHFAAELVLELFYRALPGVGKIGAHIAQDKARIDFAWPESISPRLAGIASAANVIVQADLVRIYVVSCGTGGGLVVLRGRRCQGRTKSGRSRTLDIAAPSLTLPPGRGRQPAALGMEDNSGLPSLDRFPMIETLFTQALGLVAPWQVDQVIFTPEAGRIDFQVTFSAAVHACPACRTAAQPLHDRLARSWRHLDFFQYEAHLHAAVPRVACAVCDKVTQIPVPWAREGSRFTLLFEALTLMLAPTMSVLAAGRLLRVRSRRLWRVIEHHVNKARAKESHAEVRAIGVDETASKRGQTYITVFHDLDKPRLLFATPGRDKATLGMFATDLTEHGGQPSAITHVSMDMSGSFQAGAAEHFPEAEVCFDRFHVVALGSTALDEVRRAEVKSEPELKGTRWSLHKKPADWTIKQTQTMHWLQRSNLKTARAWRIKEALRAIYATAKTPDEAKPLLKRWLSWACRCRLEPFKRLGRTITKHLPGVLNGFESGKHNGRVEAMNRALQEARARARGYRRVDNFIAMAYLIAGKLIHLPVSPFVPFRPVPHETT